MRLRLLVATDLADLGFQRRRGRERVTRDIVDELGEDIPRRAVDDQPWPRRAARDLLAYPQMPPGARGSPAGGAAPAAHMRSRPGARHVLLTSLPGLAADLLARVPHALALVGVWLAKLADVRGDLADLLLVNALDDEPGGGLDPEGDPFGRAHHHRVAETERELQVPAPGLHPVANADDLEGLGVARRHASHHVGDQRPGQSVQRPDLAFVRWPGNRDHAVVLLDFDRHGNLHAQRALRPLHGDVAAADRHVYTRGHGDGHPSDS